MPKRHNHNWPELFSDFEQSGLSQAEFCKQHNLSPTYFSQKLSQHRAAASSSFAQLIVEPIPPAPRGLVIEVGDCKVHCPDNLSIDSLVTLIRSLA